jgi:hypothetical protein
MMFALTYSLIYLFVMLIYLIDLLKIDIYPKGLTTFYKREINTNLMSNLVVHPFYLVGKGWTNQMSNAERVLRDYFDVDSVIGFYLFVLFKFILMTWTFLFIYGILQIVVDLGTDESMVSLRTKGVGKYMTLIMCVGTFVGWFFLTSIVNLIFKKSNQGNKTSEGFMAVCAVLCMLVVILCIIYFLIVIKKDDTSLQSENPEIIMFSAIKVFRLEKLFEIILMHTLMCLFFVVIIATRYVFFRSKTIDGERSTKKKLVIIALCMNIIVFAFVKLHQNDVITQLPPKLL